jgi:hypothetical protein
MTSRHLRLHHDSFSLMRRSSCFVLGTPSFSKSLESSLAFTRGVVEGADCSGERK